MGIFGAFTDNRYTVICKLLYLNREITLCHTSDGHLTKHVNHHLLVWRSEKNAGSYLVFCVVTLHTIQMELVRNVLFPLVYIKSSKREEGREKAREKGS